MGVLYRGEPDPYHHLNHIYCSNEGTIRLQYLSYGYSLLLEVNGCVFGERKQVMPIPMRSEGVRAVRGTSHCCRRGGCRPITTQDPYREALGVGLLSLVTLAVQARHAFAAAVEKEV